MRIAGIWQGWGLGDWSHNPDGSDNDPTVRKAKAYMRAMFRSYAGHLADTNNFDQQMYDVVVIMQDKLVARPMTAVRLVPGNFLRGVLDLPTQQAMGFKKIVTVLPIIFSVEGHLSNLFFGPAADNAQRLESQGVCHAKPTNYDCAALPFNDKSGVDALTAMLNSTAIEGPPVDFSNPDGPKIMWPFPDECHWGITGFSQGAGVISKFMRQQVLPANGACHHRLASFRRGLAIGNPYREFGKMAPWNDNPPPKDTGGIMDNRFVTTGTEIADRWQENANDGDMFAVNTGKGADLDKTAIAKIVVENSWAGGPAAILARVLAIFGNPVGGAYDAIVATVQAIIFAAKNPNPHYGTVAEPGDIEWMRGVR